MTEFRAGGSGSRRTDAAHCSVYVLQATRKALLEGNGSIGCREVDAPAEVALDGIALEKMDSPRADKLRTALRRAKPEVGDGQPAHPWDGPERTYRIRVRLVTNRRTLEGEVPPVGWPPPGAEATAAVSSARPVGLAELWEAVMYPDRYQPEPARRSGR